MGGVRQVKGILGKMSGIYCLTQAGLGAWSDTE